jgi:GNAT superfamily N-acetyltransferase
LWGNPEGVGVDWDDSATKKFLARKGFAPRAKGIHLGRRLDAGDLPAAGEARFVGWLPELGGPIGRRRRLRPCAPFETAVALVRGKVRGVVATFELPEVRPGLFAVYEGAVLPSERGGPMGPALLGAALARLRDRGAREVEVLTVPEWSPHAHGVYLAAGFRPLDSWVIY